MKTSEPKTLKPFLKIRPVKWGLVHKPASEGVPQSYVYDYMLKDHLGNVRMVLSDEVEQNAYPAATLETANLSSEKNYYTIPDGMRVNRNSVGSYPTNDNYSSLNDWGQQFSGSGVKVGSGIVLKVMAGD